MSEYDENLTYRFDRGGLTVLVQIEDTLVRFSPSFRVTGESWSPMFRELLQAALRGALQETEAP